MYAYLEQANERVPSAEEIARELDMSVNDVEGIDEELRSPYIYGRSFG